MHVGETIDNRTICDFFGVAHMGGIRVNNGRSLIVLISNNTDPTYKNEWRPDGTLHFVGRGSVGPQKLDRQNRTLANAMRRGYAVHLFEVHERGRYVYAGEVEQAGEPYMSDQPDARAEDRFVWVFPLRKKDSAPRPEPSPEAPATDYLPHGAYAVIGKAMTDEQRALVHEALDRLKEAGVLVTDQRDVDLRRYGEALGRWQEAVLDRVRVKVRELIANRVRFARRLNPDYRVVDDELMIGKGCTEAELRAALSMLDRDEPASQQEVFEEARREVPMPDPPKWMQEAAERETEMPEPPSRKRIDPDRLRDVT